MALVVVDASVVAALLFLEPQADALAKELAGCTLAAPDLLPYEIANVAAMKVRRRLITPGGAQAALDLLGRLDVRLHPVEPLRAFETAMETGLTAYDGAYVWLSHALGARIATLDARVARATRKPTS
jgi:predicted nucleic acid-binding protein